MITACGNVDLRRGCGRRIRLICGERRLIGMTMTRFFPGPAASGTQSRPNYSYPKARLLRREKFVLALRYILAQNPIDEDPATDVEERGFNSATSVRIQPNCNSMEYYWKRSISISLSSIPHAMLSFLLAHAASAKLPDHGGMTKPEAVVELGKLQTNPPALPADKSPFFRRLEARLLALLPALSCAFMLYSSGTAIYQSNGDPGTIFFVAGSLSILAGLYVCMHEFEKAVAQRATPKKERLKLVIWLLAISLNTLFSYRVTSVLDSTIFSIIIWSIAGITTIIGCFLMFSSSSSRH